MSIGTPVIGKLDNPPALGCAAVFHHHRLGIIAGIGLQTVGAVGVLNDSEPLGIHNPAGRCLGPDLDDGVVLGRLVGDFHSRPCGAHGNQRIVPGGGIELDFKLLALAAVEAALGINSCPRRMAIPAPDSLFNPPSQSLGYPISFSSALKVEYSSS